MWSIILHGGAKTIDAKERAANREGCVRALHAGIAILTCGGSGIDAAEAVVRALEDDTTFNAGFGSVQNACGDVETCAAIMEGRDFNVGAVAVAKGLQNPISAARAMLFREPTLIAGDGARAFAEEVGVALCSPAALICSNDNISGDRSHDTVGCIVLDTEGRFTTAVSTGGLEGTPPGRIGDSPQSGCGFYCDDSAGGVVFSGDGEHIARMMLAARVMHTIDALGPTGALEAALRQLERIGGEAGGIVLTPDGTVGWAHNSPHFAIAYATSDDPAPKVFLSKAEELNA